MSMWMKKADAQQWFSARNLADLGELTARWLEGDLASQPGYEPNCGPDEETLPLVNTLTAANRAGYVTIGSQPGTGQEEGCNPLTGAEDGTLWEQRAAVEGFATPELAGSLVNSANEAGLLAWTEPVLRGWQRRNDAWLDVTVARRKLAGVALDEDWMVITSFGAQWRRRDIRFHFQEVRPSVIRALYASRLVTIAATEYGPSDALWRMLDRWAEQRKQHQMMKESAR